MVSKRCYCVVNLCSNARGGDCVCYRFRDILFLPVMENFKSRLGSALEMKQLLRWMRRGLSGAMTSHLLLLHDNHLLNWHSL